MPPPHSVDDEMFSSLAFDAGAGSGLVTSTLCRSFASLSGGGFDNNSVQSRESLVRVPVTSPPQSGAGTQNPSVEVYIVRRALSSLGSICYWRSHTLCRLNLS